MYHASAYLQNRVSSYVGHLGQVITKCTTTRYFQRVLKTQY